MLRIAFAVLILLPPSANLWAGLSNQVTAPLVRASLIAERDAIVPGQTLELAIRLVMLPGVHTYWQNPGDAGMATSIAWRLPPGFRVGPIRWPYPRRFSADGIVSFGYSEEVLLLVQVHAPAGLRPGMVVRLAGRADWLACKEVCIPESAEIAILLPVRESPGELTSWAPAMASARSAVPASGAGWRFHLSQGAGKEVILGVSPPEDTALQNNTLHFFPREGGLIEAGGVQRTVEEAGNRLRMYLPVSTFRTTPIQSLSGVLVSRDPKGHVRAVRVDTRTEAGPAKRKDK